MSRHEVKLTRTRERIVTMEEEEEEEDPSITKRNVHHDHSTYVLFFVPLFGVTIHIHENGQRVRSYRNTVDLYSERYVHVL